MDEELNWNSLARSLTWLDLFAEMDDVHQRCTAYITAHLDQDTVLGEVGLVMAGAVACWPGVRPAVEDSRNLTKRPPRAVVEMVLNLSRQARQVWPDAVLPS